MCIVYSSRISPTPIANNDFTILTLKIDVTDLFLEIVTLQNDVRDRISVLTGITVDKSPTYLCEMSDTVLEKVSTYYLYFTHIIKRTKYLYRPFLIEFMEFRL